MRTKLLIALCLFMPAIVPVFAQKTATISIGGGTTIPSGNIKDSAHIRPMQAINLQAYLPVVKRTKYSIGLQAGASYGWGNQKQITTLPAGYPALNGSQNNLSLLDNGNPKNRLYQLEAGIAASISLGRRLNIMPGFVAGYLHLEQKAISAWQSTVMSIYGGNYFYSFTQKEENTKGIYFSPRLKLMYQPGNLGVWIEGGYTYGPDIINESTRSVSYSSGGFDQNIQTKTQYKAINTSLGITLGIGRHTCLICGRKHRGKCKYGYMDNNSGSGIPALKSTPPKNNVLSLSNFGITRLVAKGDKIIVHAKPVIINRMNLNLDKSIIERKITNDGIEYIFPAENTMSVHLSRNRIQFTQNTKVYILDSEKSNALVPEATVYIALAVKIEQNLKLQVKNKLNDVVINVEPSPIDSTIALRIVLDCFYIGGTSTASEARTSACASQVMQYSSCVLLGIDTSCLVDELACISIATFDCK